MGDTLKVQDGFTGKMEPMTGLEKPQENFTPPASRTEQFQMGEPLKQEVKTTLGDLAGKGGVTDDSSWREDASGNKSGESQVKKDVGEAALDRRTPDLAEKPAASPPPVQPPAPSVK